MKILSFSDRDIQLIDMEHVFIHKKSQCLKHSVAYNHYVSSAYTGYRWKGDHIKQYFETIVYRFQTDILSLKRTVIGPIMTYTYQNHVECLQHHMDIICGIYDGIYKIEDMG